MGLYYIAKKGDEPGNGGSAVLELVCARWSGSPDKASMEVIETDVGGRVIRRFSAAESEEIARQYHKLAS